MDDDRPHLAERGTHPRPTAPARGARDHAPGPLAPAARARGGDPGAFLELVRPHAGRLLVIAAIAAGEQAPHVSAAAVRSAWLDLRRLDLDDLQPALEARLVAALPRRRAAVATDDTALGRALGALGPGDRVALARCLDRAPDASALAVAGRLGVETATSGVADTADGDIVDLDGPLAGWDLARLRSALAATAGPVDVDALLEGLRRDLAAVRPARRGVAVAKAVMPGPTTALRGLALVLVTGVIAGALAWTAGLTDPAGPPASPGPAGPREPGGVGATGGRPAATPALDPAAAIAAAGFPETVDGLPVVDVVEARRLADDPALAGRAIAIRGWMSRPVLRGRCTVPPTVESTGATQPAPPGATESPRPDDLATPARDGSSPAAGAAPVRVIDPLSRAAGFCARGATIRNLPRGEWRTAHLHPQLLPGTSLGRVARAFAATDGEPIPVVLVGHFGDPRAAGCSPGGRHCGEELVVDRIAWAMGASVRIARAIHPTAPEAVAERSTTEIVGLVERAFGGLWAVSVTGVPADEISLVEPAAAGLGPGDGFVWLVRAIVDPRRGDAVGATRTWLIVDDASGAVTPAPGSTARVGAPAGSAFLFPAQVDGIRVRSVAEARALEEAGLPTGATLAVAGWLAEPALAGACLTEAGSIDGPRDRAAAFCRRATTIRGPATDGRVLALQLPPGTPAVAIGEADARGGMAVPVIALVLAGSPRSEPCWPTDDGCGRVLVLERLLWVDGSPTGVAVAQLDAPGADAPRLSPSKVRSIAEAATGHHERIVTIVRVPADRRDDVAPGAGASPVTGEYAWIVRVRGPMQRAGGTLDLDYLWWLVVDDATGRASTSYRTAVAPDRLV